MLAGLILVYAEWWAWYGGWFWGPRFFLMASLPASLALAVRLRRRRLRLFGLAGVLAVLTLSIWVGVDGAAFGLTDDLWSVCGTNTYAQEFLCWYTPEFSPLWRPFLTRHPPPSVAESLFVAYGCLTLAWLAAPLVRLAWARATATGDRQTS